jgi:CspA family cold shock protein
VRQDQNSIPYIGVVKWFSPEKGYGFIAPEGIDEDVFVHMTVLKKTRLHTLEEGQKVKFHQEKGKKGMQATLVEVI